MNVRFGCVGHLEVDDVRNAVDVEPPGGHVLPDPAQRRDAAGRTADVEQRGHQPGKATTDDAGNYSVPELPIGPYEVRVEQTGFVASVVSNVTVEVASERRVDVKLSVSGGETTVVVATNVQVETTTNTLGGTITTRTAADLPSGRKPMPSMLTSAS